MPYIIIYIEKAQSKPEFIIVEDENSLLEIVDKISKSGKEPTIDIYEATKLDYKLTYEDKTETIIKKIPKIDIIR